MRRRGAAAAALVLGAVVLAGSLALMIGGSAQALAVLACLAVAVAGAWFGVRRRGGPRGAGLGIAVLALAGAVAIIALGGHLL